jgi:two-component system sensor histidine kinase YesM
MHIFSAILFFAVAIMLLYNNYSAINILRNELCNTAQELLAVSQKRMNDSFSLTASYLATFTYQNVDIQTLERATPDTTAYHTAMERIKRQFTNSLPAYSMDSFFYYDPSRPLYFANVNDIHTPMRKAISGMQNDIAGQAGKDWFALQADTAYYLVRVVRVSHSYVGAWIQVPSALELVRNDQFTGNEVYLLNNSGVFLSKDAPTPTLNAQAMAKTGGYTFVPIAHKSWLAVTQKANFGNFYLATLIPDASISSSLNRLTLVIIAAGIFAFAIIAFGTTLLNSWIVKPVSQLTAAIRALKNGDFQASLPANTYDEFREVNNAFNTATEEIKALKIDMYEERLTKQKIQMQYLQMQVAPHFLINCLNTIYQLTDMNQQELTRTMLRTLSRHLRYTLSSSQTVSLREELTHVENYLELSSVRYPDSIILIKDYDPEALNAVAIPLLILNFVENTIKFEAIVGKRLELHISVRRLPESTKPCVHIQIWDTGAGFSNEILDDLKDIPAYIRKHQDQHIGISNVFQRASILFDDCRFQFSNRAGAGAQIDIMIPYLPFSRKEDSA